MHSTVQDALKEALTPPDHYWGAITDLCQQGWAQVAGRHRDSDVLNISNWETMLAHYNEHYEVQEDFRVEGSSHWLVGWSDCLLVRALQCKCEDWEDADISFFKATEPPEKDHWYCATCGDFEIEVRPVFHDALEFAERLADYPVLDDSDWSMREWNELHDYLDDAIYRAYNSLTFDQLELTDEGYKELERIVSERVTEYACNADDVGDITELVEDAYITVLLQDVTFPQEGLFNGQS